MLTNNELSRYARHISLNDFGVEAQEKLKNSKILVVGAGGLGSPVLQYLAAAGVGLLGIIDNDTVSLSNLQRQILYEEKDIGKKKVDIAAKKIKSLNSNTTVRTYDENLDNKNALRIVSFYDLVIDGSDNFPTRYLVNDACVILHKPFVFGSIFKYEGQVAVFNYNNGPTYRCLFPTPPKNIPNCTEAGVIGVLPGLIGSLQANEAIKVITGLGEILCGKLLLINSLNLSFNSFNVKKDKTIVIKDLASDYESFCGVPSTEFAILSNKLKELINKNQPYQLIDIREKKERKNYINGAEYLLLKDIKYNPKLLKQDCPVVLYCQTGKRTSLAIQELRQKFNLTNVFYLAGGIAKWNE